MQKTAQKRGLLDKLIENSGINNISGIAAEKFFNPEFKEVMETLRKKDDTIRSIVAGEIIGDGDPGDSPIALKKLLKNAKSNINRREYMSATADLGWFHKKILDISKEINGLDFKIDAIHYKFLFKDDDQRKILTEMGTRLANNQKQLLFKEAGIMDFLHNMINERGKALATWEKRYPNKFKKLKTDIVNLFDRSESLLNVTLSSLKEMARARATRDVDSYMGIASKIISHNDKYDSLFKDFYNSNVKEFLEKLKKIESISPSVKLPDAKNLNNQNIPDLMPGPTGPTGTIPGQPISENPFPLVQQKVKLEEDSKVSDTDPAGPPVMEDKKSADEFKSDQIAREMGLVTSHSKFFNSLQSLSNEDPLILASYISKYAKSIQNTDLPTAIKLFSIVKNIKG